MCALTLTEVGVQSIEKLFVEVVMLSMTGPALSAAVCARAQPVIV
jgi:hypothetical protein